MEFYILQFNRLFTFELLKKSVVNKFNNSKLFLQKHHMVVSIIKMQYFSYIIINYV